MKSNVCLQHTHTNPNHNLNKTIKTNLSQSETTPSAAPQNPTLWFSLCISQRKKYS